MACESCNGSSKSYPYSVNCKGIKSNCTPTDATCVNYTGAGLLCIDPPANPNLEEIILSIDAKLCQAMGAWGDFDYHCLAEDFTISTPEEFVDVISNYVCTLRSDYDTFITTTFPTTITGIEDSIDAIINPNLTLCSSSGIVGTDNLSQVLTKLANGICSIKSEINPSGADWNACFVTTPIPTTVTEGFDALISQICQLAESTGTVTLPTFNNVGSCLPAPLTATDTLVSTINKIKTRLCQTGTIDIDILPWGCVTNPASGQATNLQAALGQVISTLNTLVANDTTFDPDYFIVTSDSCSGRTVTLDTDTIGADRFVASDASDASPGTLTDKLQAGTNITLDNLTNPGKVIINGAANTDQLVKVRVADPSAGYLEDKVAGIDNAGQGIEIVKTTNVSTNKVEFEGNLNFNTIASNILTEISSDPDLYAQFCALICGCEPCNGTTSTTTTLQQQARVMMSIINNTGQTININTVLNQNAPTLGLINNNLTIAAQTTNNTGWYNLTTPILPYSTSLTVSNPNNPTNTYDITIQVLQPSNTIVPGSTTVGTTTLGANYTNANFFLGSVNTDLRIVITVNNFA